MQEVLRRERVTDVVRWEMGLLAIGTLMGQPGKAVFERVDIFRKELEPYINQTGFGLEPTMDRMRKQLYDLRKDQRMLERLAALTVE